MAQLPTCTTDPSGSDRTEASEAINPTEQRRRGRMTTEIDFARHTQIRSRIRATLETLKAEGISTGELIECTGNELHLLKLQDQRDFEACTDADDCTQRLKENPYDPLEEVRAEHEDFLTDLEAAAVRALALDDWEELQIFILSYNPITKEYKV